MNDKISVLDKSSSQEMFLLILHHEFLVLFQGLLYTVKCHIFGMYDFK